MVAANKIVMPNAQTPEENLAAALNEQGFLFSQVVREKIKFDRPGNGQPQTAWKFLAQEYAVTPPDGSQTRIDLVLQNNRNLGNFVCAECKRANPLYKQWMFFDRDRGPGGTLAAEIYFESLIVSRRPIATIGDAHHGMERYLSGSCPVFNFYLEVAVNRERKAGYTETIEEAFLQVTRGQAGFMSKQLKFQGPMKIVAIPIVVTTAQLFEAQYEAAQISLRDGTIKASDVRLQPLEFCAVNYHANDKLAVRSDHAPVCTKIEDDVLFWQSRTVFVVQSDSIVVFLNWLDSNIVR